ncbi:HalOD1 output domain-containing protein [Halopiger djelfimassiliensis]|uniref:HalOD1 output domain-containing protein n=1 Tax=Halopiger djelfimassiliensis TaxID=1293047 RepID=UPI000677AE02|nr:HalOD1 output domain-containing protein [Halopiger djelfimassiliensis]
MHGHAPPEPQSRPPSLYRAYHDPDGPATLSTTVIHALADCMGVDVTDGRISLYDAVDPDALDDLFRPRHDGSPRTGGTLTFVVDDHRVTVTSDGEILIEPPARR